MHHEEVAWRYMFHEHLHEQQHYHQYDKSSLYYGGTPKIVPNVSPMARTLEPYVTGTSIIGLKYADGVMIAGDTLASYGSLARFREIQRIKPVGEHTLIGASGEYSDFQFILKYLDDLVMDDECMDDGSRFSPKSIHSWLTRVMYQRRNKFDPLWNTLVVAGYENGESLLGVTDNQGNSYRDEHVATGFGAYIARPLLRDAWLPNLPFEAAKRLTEECMRVLYYRDARAHNKIQIGTVTQKGTFISDPYEITTDWSVGSFARNL